MSEVLNVISAISSAGFLGLIFVSGALYQRLKTLNDDVDCLKEAGDSRRDFEKQVAAELSAIRTEVSNLRGLYESLREDLRAISKKSH